MSGAGDGDDGRFSCHPTDSSWLPDQQGRQAEQYSIDHAATERREQPLVSRNAWCRCADVRATRFYILVSRRGNPIHAVGCPGYAVLAAPPYASRSAHRRPSRQRRPTCVRPIPPLRLQRVPGTLHTLPVQTPYAYPRSLLSNRDQLQPTRPFLNSNRLFQRQQTPRINALL